MPDKEKSKEELLAAYYDALLEKQEKEGALTADIEVQSSFVVTEEEQKRIEVWRKEQDAKVVQLQRESSGFKENPYVQALLRRGIPYYGSFKGALEYIFVPDGLRRVFIVIHNVTKETLDLSDDPDDGPHYTNVMTPWSTPVAWTEAAELEKLEDEGGNDK